MRILIVKNGSTHPRVEESYGDYDLWFREALGGDPGRFLTVSPFLGEALPPLEGIGGILLTGSPASVRDEAPWMEAVSRFIHEAEEREIPVLGVCFGHQLLGEAFGGRVERSPGGWEFGTVSIVLTEEGRKDPLFTGLPPTFLAHSVHQDELLRVPEGAIRLAGNERSKWQAFSLGPRLRAVQFHLETSEPIMRAIARALGREAEIRPTEAGPRILRNWERHYLRRS